MSVLCCYIPDFLIGIHRLRYAEDARPLALLGGDERIWAVSSEARALGVHPDIAPQQALRRCPELLLHPLDGAHTQAFQDALLAELRRWELPVELADWGLAYVDIRWAANRQEEAVSLGQELGRRVRQALEGKLQPALGWDTGKFTARVAAVHTRPGHLKLVPREAEAPFLRPLPVTLLPLPPETLLRLRWLGIRTLGQFAQLPETAVWQRFGPEGKAAWQWAQGRDNRPVEPSGGVAPSLLAVEFEHTEARLEPVTTALLAALRPELARLRARLSGVRRLHMTLCFSGGAEQVMDVPFVEAVGDEQRLGAVLAQRLAAYNWPGPLETVRLTLLETGELPVLQPALFPEFNEQSDPLTDLYANLKTRYGAVFFTSEQEDLNHPLPERRGRWRSAI